MTLSTIGLDLIVGQPVNGLLDHFFSVKVLIIFVAIKSDPFENGLDLQKNFLDWVQDWCVSYVLDELCFVRFQLPFSKAAAMVTGTIPKENKVFPKFLALSQYLTKILRVDGLFE